MIDVGAKFLPDLCTVVFDFDLKVIGKGGGIAGRNFAPISVIIPNTVSCRYLEVELTL